LILLEKNTSTSQDKEPAPLSHFSLVQNLTNYNKINNEPVYLLKLMLNTGDPKSPAKSQLITGRFRVYNLNRVMS